MGATTLSLDEVSSLATRTASNYSDNLLLSAHDCQVLNKVANQVLVASDARSRRGAGD